MKVAFPTSIPTIPKVDISSTYVGFDCLLKCPGFVEALNTKANQGATIMHIGSKITGYAYPEKLNTVVSVAGNHWGNYELNGNRRGAIVVAECPDEDGTWYRKYEDVCSNSDISVIAIAMPILTGGSHVSSPFDNILRITYIKALVDAGKFCTDKVHWLYGVSNPAELGMYHQLFTSFVASRFELAICSTCFLYSIFGIPFSMSTGITERLPEIHDTRFGDLGMHPWITYMLNREQIRQFFLNVDTVQEFASGVLADKYVSRVFDMLEEGVV